MKTREQIKKYNKEYFSRPEVIARAKTRNAERREKRKEYKKTEKGREAENRYRRGKYQKDKLKGKHLMARYRMTIEDYENLLYKQKGACAICKVKKGKELHVDHCHKTGIVRGLLCGNCNRALGLMKDNMSFLKNAIEYLLD